MTPAAGIKAIGYARVSTARQGESGHGLDAQEATIRKVCEERGWQLARIAVEVESSRKARPLLQEVMGELAKSGGVLVVAKDDRVSRSTMETLAIHEKAGKEGWHFYAGNMPTVDTSTPDGKFMMTVMAAFAELERERIRDRTRAALARAKVNGTKSGKPIGRPRAMPQCTVERLRQLRAQGLSYERIAATLNDEGIPGAHGGRWAKRSAYLACRRYLPTATRSGK